MASVATGAGFAPDDQARQAIGSVLVVGGFLLVPAAVYPPVIGAMFPQYWHATPVVVVRTGPLPYLLLVVAAIAGFGPTVLLLAPTWPLVAGLAVLVAVGATLAVLLTADALSLLDPMQVLDRLRADCMRGGQDQAIEAFGDLCRFTRGMRERRRRDTAVYGVRYIGECWAGRHHDLTPRLQRLAINTLGETGQQWPRTVDVSPAVAAAVKAVEANPPGGPDPA
jgi:hypothetical protein